MLRSISTAVVCLLAMMSVAAARESKSDVAISGTGFFTNNTNGNGISQTPTNSGGLLASYRYGFGNHSALELNYGYSRNSQVYNNTSIFSFAEQAANVHEFTGDYVLKLRRIRNFHPFVMAGGGALVFSPITNTIDSITGASTQARGTFLYGGGLNYNLLRNVGLRLQYRGLIYKAPDFGSSTFSSENWTHTAEPALGLTFRF
jgi:opacity protein-like surface antigen